MQTLRPNLLSALPLLCCAFLLACGGGNGGNDPEPTELTFTAPSDGTVFDPNDDVDGETDGVQVEITLSGQAEDGVVIALATDGGSSFSWTVAGGLEAWPTQDAVLTLAAGDNVITATATDADGTELASASVTVRLDGVVIPDPSLTIDEPLTGDNINADDDTDADTDGIQIDVLASAEDIADGATVTLFVDDVQIAEQALASGAVAFSGVTLDVGARTIRVETTVGDDTYDDSVSVTVEDDEVTTCEVTLSPAPAGEGCDVDATTEDADPDTDGVQVTFTITSTCASSALLADGTALVEDIDTTDGDAEVTVTLPEGEVVLVATTTDGADASDESDPQTYVIDTVAPTLALDASETGLLIPGDDEDLGVDGLQTTVSGTSDLPAEATVTVTVEGDVAGTATVGDDGAWSAQITFETTGTYDVVASASDACANEAVTDTQTLDVYVVTPALAIDAPANGALLNAGDDAAPEVDGPQVVYAISGEFDEGTPVQLACRQVADSELPFVVFATGTFGADGTAQIEATLNEGANACRAEVNVPFEIRGEPVIVTADIVTPIARITAPRDSARINTTDVELSVVYDDSRLGDLLEAFVAMNGADEVALPIDGLGTLTTVPGVEGSNTAVVRVVDLVGNESTDSVTFEIDITPPTLGVVFPTVDQVIPEEDVTVAGSQLSISVDVTVDDIDDGTELCVQSGVQAPICDTMTATGAVTVDDVSVLPGANTLTITLTDAAGNVASETVPFTVDLPLPRISIDAPTDGLRTNDGTPIDVEVSTDLADGIDVTLFNNGSSVATLAVDASGDVVFTGVTLSEGLNTLTVEGTDARGTGASPAVEVTLDQSPPVLTFVSPLDADVLDGTTPDASGAAGFQQDVVVDVDDIEPGTPATLTIDCDGAVSESVANFGADGVTFDAVTLAGEAICTLTVSTTDVAGNDASASITITVDVLAPVLRFSVPSAGNIITSTRDVSADPGIQVNLQLAVENGSAGQTATVSMVSDSRPEPLVTETTALAEGSVQVTIPEYTLDDGIVALSANMVDDVGNAADEVTIVVTVASDDTGVRVTTPGPGTTLGADDDVNSVEPGLQTTVVGTVFGPFEGFDTNLCIRSFDAGTYPTPCDAPGFRQLASTTTALGEARWTGVSLPEGAVDLSAELDLGDGTVRRGLNVSSFTVDTTPPEVLTVVAVDDANGDDRLNATEYAGATTEIRATFSGIDQGATATLFTNNPAPRTQLGTSVVGSGALSVFDVTLAEGDHELFVEARDSGGNLPSPVLTLDLEVDRSAPTLSFTRPGAGATLLVANDASMDPGLQFDVRLATDAADGTIVSVTSTGDAGAQTLGDLTVTGGVAGGVLTLPEGNNTLSASVSDPAGNATNVTRDVFVDGVGPNVTWVVPPSGATVTLDEVADLEPSTPGRQIDIQVDFTNVETGQAIALTSQPSGATVATGLTVPASGSLSTRVTLFESGEQTLQAAVSDVSGNMAMATSGTIDVQIDNCGLRFAALPSTIAWNIAADDGDAGNGFTTDIQVLVDDAACFGQTLDLLVDGATIASLTITDGDETFTGVTFADGDAGTLQARSQLPDTSFVFSPTTTFVVDLTAPATPTIDPNDGPTVIGVADASPTGGVGTVDFTIAAPDAIGGTFTIEGPSGTLASGALSTSPQSVAEVALDEGTYTLTFTVTDAAGNETETNATYTVVWSPPGTPIVLAELVNPRAGETTLRFEPDVNAVSYEVRRASAAITTGNWAAATLVDTVTSPFTTNGSGQVEVTIPALDFQQTHHFGVRATDAAANQTDVGQASVFVGLVTVDMTDTTLAGASDIDGIGDVNGDGFDDVAFGYQAEAVQVVYGGATEADFVVQTLSPPADAGFFGYRVHTPGDVNGDGRPDLLVTAPLASPDGLAFLYFGVAPTDENPVYLPATPDVTIRYEDAAGTTRRLGISNLDGQGDVLQVGAETIDDVILAASSDGAGTGRVFLIAGRETWPATLDITEDVATNHANDVAQIDGISVSGDYGISLAVLGDLDSDGIDDFAASAYDASTVTNGRFEVFVGRTMADFPAIAPALLASDAEYSFGGPFGSSRWSRDGITVTGDLDGDLVLDWIVSDANYDAFDIFSGGAVLAAAGGESTRVTGATIAGRDVLFARIVSLAGDVDDDGDADLFIRTSPAVGSSDLGYVSIMRNDGSGGFPNADLLDFADIDGRTPAGVGDINGDGYPDLATAVANGGAGFDLRLFY